MDYFVAGYCVWARMIQALADLGYEPNNMASVLPCSKSFRISSRKQSCLKVQFQIRLQRWRRLTTESCGLQVTEPYDWRLALPNLEKRDAYFTRLKARIEVLSKAQGEKVSGCSQPHHI